MAYSKPSVDDFKAYFFRDFPYGTDPATSILDLDIAKAYGQTDFNFNSDLFGTQADYTLGYLLLAAHWLVIDIRMSSQGIAGKYSWLTTNKAVGSVSEGYQIPQRILDNPELAQLSQTNYGAKFLQLILPQLSGQIFFAHGRTHA